MELGIDTLGVMKSIKQALGEYDSSPKYYVYLNALNYLRLTPIDPHWIMNPGKIIDIPQ